MKKILLSLVALFATVSLVSAMTGGVTYTVTVPSGTNTVYIAGAMNGWNTTANEMTKVNATTFTVTIDAATEADEYKYLSGPDWAYEEVALGGGNQPNRTWVPEGDIVAQWKSVYDPGVQVTYSDFVVQVQSTQGAPTIWWWGGGQNLPNADANNTWPGPAMTAGANNWYSYTLPQVNEVTGVSIIISIGDVKIVDGATIMGSKCYTEAGAETTCPTVGIQSTFDAAVVAANGTISADADFAIINLAGVDVTAQNGSLAAGAYIVKLANGAAQIVTLK
jgi:hypothetical protein